MKKHYLYICTIIAVLLINSAQAEAQIYTSSAGTVEFTSDAPLEMINASSNKLTGVLNAADGTFSFKIAMSSFKGFNSDLQRTHFNENYLETVKFPNATFKGSIIEDIDFTANGTVKLRAKGKLEIHGTEQTRIIKSEVKVQGKKLIVTSTFTVPLVEHNIKVPQVVSQKIAEEIYVKITIELITK
ncbi:MAG TPA: YceI family protein [Bacteroidales bacterium]|nr:YceI family protein [Bacteroidales bacterium]